MRSISVKHKGKLHRLIVDAVRERVRASTKEHQTRPDEWRKAEELFVGYLPEKEDDRLRRANREEGEPDYTTIQLPYSYAIATAAHSYWASVFLSRSPVFQFAGQTGEGQDQVLAIEALQSYQLYKARQLANLFIWLQDVAKYGEAWISPYWRIDRARVSRIVEEQEMFAGMVPTGKMKRVRKVDVVTSYQGNALYNVHPARVFTDPRYARNRFQEGEFVIIETKLSYNQLLEGQAEGQYINVDSLPRRSGQHTNFFDTQKQDSAAPILETPESDSFSTAYDPKASDVFDVYEVTINLVPDKWGLGKSDLPEKWVFTVTSDYQAVVECRPLGNLHNKFPLAQLETDMEAYAHFSRSLMEVYGPIQTTLDWLVNSHFFNVRQAINNNFVIDPSRVNVRDFESRKPGKAFRLTPAAYGTDVRTAVQQLPVTDATSGHLANMDAMYSLGERLGVNDPVMGMTNPSSRRSATEVRGNQTFGVSRLRTISEYMSATGWDDLSHMMVTNSQQFYSAEQKLRIVGEAAKLSSNSFIDVTPEMIAGEFLWEPVDGTLPVDRYAQVNLWRELMAQMYQVPQVVQQYDLGKIFGYVAQLGGIKNLDRFKVEVVPDEQMMRQAEAGNSVPASGNFLEPGQVPGNGPTA